MIESQELTDYIKAVIKAIDTATKEAASPNYNKAPDRIVFNVAMVNAKKAEGGFKLWVVNAEGKYAKEEINKLEFEYKNSGSGPKVFFASRSA
jgi:hypothetical protein